MVHSAMLGKQGIISQQDVDDIHKGLQSILNDLHSGLHGFDKTVFDMGFEGDDTLVLTAASPDGTDGFPGNAELEAVSYTHLT